MKNPNICECDAASYPHRPFSVRGCFADELFDRIWERAECEDCPKLQCVREPHGETLCECTVFENEGPSEWEGFCPVLEEKRRKWKREQDSSHQSK